jgi:hypothetical protein
MKSSVEMSFLRRQESTVDPCLRRGDNRHHFLNDIE